MLPVTRAFLPSIEEYQNYLKVIWENRWLTNHGPMVTKLQEELKSLLGVPHLFVVANGTVALQIALRALQVKREVITTPFSYVASTSSIVWEGATPRFVDVDKDTWCLDPDLVRKSITEKTDALLPVHVYGNNCAVEEFEDISKSTGIPVIYDGAHAFGSLINNRSLLSYGDITTVSLHATKLFHSGEGGLIIVKDDEVAHRVSYLMNFGHDGPDAFEDVGINGKCSELHAAMALAILPHVPAIIESRRERSSWYDDILFGNNRQRLIQPIRQPELQYNYAYYPIVLESEEAVLGLRELLRSHGILSRRYFYPALNTLSYVKYEAAPIAEDISRRVICLPLFHDIPRRDVEKVANLVGDFLRQGARE